MIEFIRPDFVFEDNRGILIQLIHEGWKQVNFIKSSSNVVRGKHYHKVNKEAFYVISGNFKLLLEDVITNTKESYVLKGGDFFIIKQNVIHSFEFTEETLLVSFYDVGVENNNGKKDIFSL